MSDEYQPNEVVESQPEPDVMPAEPAAPDAEGVDRPEAGPTTARMEVTSSEASPVEEVPLFPVAAEEPAVEVSTPPVEERPTREVAFAVESAAIPGAVPVEAPAAETEPASTVVSIADLEQPRRASEPKTTGMKMPALGTFLKERGWIAAVVVVLILIVLMFLPPISLAERLSSGNGYLTLDGSNPSVTHPDGLTVSRASDAEGRVRVKLGSIPRADFVAGTVPDELSGAVQSIPAYLDPKSPYYTIDLRTNDPVAGEMAVVIPNEAEPWETLDLYAWDGAGWHWLPTALDREGEVLVSTVDALPASVVVMQSTTSARRIATVAETWPAGAIDPAVTEVDVPGILIGTMGGTTGYIDDLPAASAGGHALVIPTVRNWLPGREANWALVSDMVQQEADRSAHVANLVALAQDGGYPGLVVDYRNVQAGDRAAFSTFIQALGSAFDAAGLGLAVVVDTPQRSEGGTWDTAGYDWAVVGAAADQLRVVMPLAPAAYVPGGDAEQLVAWAVTQVDRHKLLPVYSTLSTDGESLMTLDEVLGSLDRISVRQTLTESVEPGTLLNFSLGSGVSVETDPETQATQVMSGGRAVWLGTPQWLQARTDLAARHQLGGVVLRNLYDEGQVGDLTPALTAYQSGASGGSFTLPDVTWEVTGPTGQTMQATSQISRPEFAWIAPEVTGTYQIAAMVGALDKGALEILVAAPTPVITETVAEGVEAEAEEPEEPEEVETDPTLRAGFVADVTVPDNTRFEQGEAFVKTWRLRNAGTVDWPEDTVFVFTGGAELSADKEIEVGVVESGENVDLSVDMVAPEEDGTFRSTWELRAGGRSIQGGGVYTQIQVGEPAEEETPPPQAETPVVAPRPVASGAFELGGHIRDYGIPYKDKMHYAGMNWVKIQVHFGQGASGAINAAHANGFKIQLSAIGGAAMTAQPGFADEYAAWVAGLAAAGADAIEVWNEPNIDREWQIGQISPQAYTNLLCKAYNAIKGANARTDVISAAPAPTGWFGGCGPNGCDDKPWMEGLYAAGAANCMDYIGAHHNAGATSPSARIGHPANPGDTHHSWFFLPQTELYYNIFRGTRKIVYTEMGYASQEGVPGFSDQFAWARGTNNAQQAAWLAEAVQLSINTGMVRLIIVWNIDFVRYGYDPQDGFAIIRPGGGCPACDALHNVLGTR